MPRRGVPRRPSRRGARPVLGGIGTAEFAPNRDEDLAYTLRLLQAEASAELHQWPGTLHGSQALLSAGVSQRRVVEMGAALRRGFR
ncbi:hypothetical protein ACIBJF_40990 [Streptomyces sp. NPDC050743]|uniref:hypothetical protein n=1 Tax=Streptomyces sp. NPDC050743 TaxID=3365634 RepID=UPI0037B27376